MSEIKPFKTFEEQIEILKYRGLIIHDRERVIKTLQHVNYYRISGYTLTLRKNDVFYKGITFDNVMELYNFDCELRTLLSYLLENVEISFRTHIAYYHAEKYGAIGYLNSDGFEDANYYSQFIDELNNIIKNENRSNEVFIKHYKDKYDNRFPLWVVVELLSFGSLSRLYRNSSFEIKQKIAVENYEIKYDYIQNWLHGLVILRNICAHRGRLYNRPMSIKPKISNKDKKLGIRNDLVFIYIFILKKLIKDDKVWTNFLSMLKNTIKRYPFVELANLGFPSNWIDIL